ncbi:MAG: hypothetical protein RBU27_06865 [Bacteroidota bacterium]|jgi:hypothetical protein|nr:hypothetical protein [Bacteroidota bacterium]
MQDDAPFTQPVREPTPELDALRAQLLSLEQRLTAIEHRQTQMPALPSTNLLSGSFLARAFAVLGHNLVAWLIIAIPLNLLIFVIILFVGVSLSGL